MGLLGLLPEQFYDLTPVETVCLVEGAQQAQLDTARHVRRLATLLRNAHFKDPQSEAEYWPLPEDATPAPSKAEGFVQFLRLQAAMGGEITPANA